MPRALAFLALVACSGGGSTVESDPPMVANVRTSSCAEQAGEMKTFMRDLFENRPVAPPWATGDPALDREVEEHRAKLRELMTFDPDKPAAPLAGTPQPGPIDHELASCPPATEQLVKVGDAETTEEKLAAWIGIADAIEACKCRPRIAYLKPLFHLLARGPD